MINIHHRDPICFFCNKNKGKFISVSRGYRNLCEDEECIKKSFKSHSVEGLMYREFLTREEAEMRFFEENERQLEKRMETFEELRKKDPLWDKKRSQYSKYFWIEKGYSKKEAIKTANNLFKKFHEKYTDYRKNNPEKYVHTYPTKIEYYLHRGYSKKEAKEIISEIQNRFSREICIEKYGKIEGIKIWEDRQNRWINTLAENGNLHCGYSAISQELFNNISEIYIDKTNIYYATNENGEYNLKRVGNRNFLYDFTDIKKKKIIEYNGDLFHANPKIYESNDTPNPFRKNLTSSEIWEKDRNKINLANENGFEVLVVWDSEYRENPDDILEKCLKFLKNN